MWWFVFWQHVGFVTTQLLTHSLRLKLTITNSLFIILVLSLDSCKASELTVNAEDLKRSAGLVKLFASQFSKFEESGGNKSFCDSLVKMAGLWGECSAAAATLISGNNEISQVVLDSTKIETWYASKGNIVLRTIVKTRKRLLKAIFDIEHLAGEATRSVELLAPDDLEQPFTDLFALAVPDAFKSELNSEAFDDLASKAASSHLNQIEEMLKDFNHKNGLAYVAKGDTAESDYFHKFANKGWQAENIGNFAELYDQASETLLSKLPGRLAKAFANDCMKD